MVKTLTPTEAWGLLRADAGVRLVDVRTEAEWQQIGVPDLDSVGRPVVLVTWQDAYGRVDPCFTDKLRGAGLTPDQTLLFLCRSGVRSLAAAEEAIHAGYSSSLNVGDGFEGHPDGGGRRGAMSGWKAEGLPWRR